MKDYFPNESLALSISGLLSGRPGKIISLAEHCPCQYQFVIQSLTEAYFLTFSFVFTKVGSGKSNLRDLLVMILVTLNFAITSFSQTYLAAHTR